MGNDLINNGHEVSKRPVGRPPAFTSSEEIQGLIDRYFKDCEGIVLKDDETGKPLLNKYDEPIIIGAKPPTITGLALALGFNSRMSLLNYEAKEEFMDTIVRAKAMIEAYTEARLFDKDGVNGAKFSLANNFKGWKEDRSLDITVNQGQQAGEVSTLRDLKKKKAIESNQEITGDIVDIEKDD